MRVKTKIQDKAFSSKILTDYITPSLNISIIQTVGIETYYDIVLEGYPADLEKVMKNIGAGKEFIPEYSFAGPFGRAMLTLDRNDNTISTKELFELYKNLIRTIMGS